MILLSYHYVPHLCQKVHLHLQVITKRDDMDHRLEPFEEAIAEVPEEYVGAVVDLLGSRRGQMQDMTTSEQGLARVTYTIPTRSASRIRLALLQDLSKLVLGMLQSISSHDIRKMITNGSRGTDNIGQ